MSVLLSVIHTTDTAWQPFPGPFCDIISMHAQSAIEVLLIYISVVYMRSYCAIPHCLHWPYPKIRSEYQWSVSCVNFHNLYLLWAMTKYEVISTSSVGGNSLEHSSPLLAMAANPRYSNATIDSKSYIDLKNICVLYIELYTYLCDIDDVYPCAFC